MFTTEPLFHSGVALPAVLSGATVVCFSFIGFDAITMYAEEARKKADVAKAIIITLLIGGAIFLVTGFVAQAIFPNVAGFHLVDDTLPEMALRWAVTSSRCCSCPLPSPQPSPRPWRSHASVSRTAPRDGSQRRLPQTRLRLVHPRRHTPDRLCRRGGSGVTAGDQPSLELISSMINFGALVAFTFVNLSVIAYFAWRRREYRTPKHIATNVALPLLGTAMTGILWSFLHKDALIAGIVWAGLGLVYVYVLGRITGRRVTDVDLREGDAAEPTPTPVPAPTPAPAAVPAPMPVPALATASSQRHKGAAPDHDSFVIRLLDVSMVRARSGRDATLPGDCCPMAIRGHGTV